jgi:hypothetical protein
VNLIKLIFNYSPLQGKEAWLGCLGTKLIDIIGRLSVVGKLKFSKGSLPVARVSNTRISDLERTFFFHNTLSWVLHDIVRRSN